VVAPPRLSAGNQKTNFRQMFEKNSGIEKSIRVRQKFVGQNRFSAPAHGPAVAICPDAGPHHLWTVKPELI